MGILKTVSIDIEVLVEQGFSDDYIAKSVGMDKSLIQYIIEYFRKEKKIFYESSNKINRKST